MDGGVSRNTHQPHLLLRHKQLKFQAASLFGSGKVRNATCAFTSRFWCDAAEMERESGSAGRPTVADLTGENHFASLARENWLTAAATKVIPNVVEHEIWNQLEREDFSYFSLLLLEQLQALERYLWPGFTEDASNHHVLLLVLLVNVKRREQLPVWSVFAETPDEFSSFFRRVLELSIDRSLSRSLRTQLLVFLIGAFQSLDSGLLRKECAPLVSIGIWQNIHSEIAREQHVAKSGQLQKAWRAAGKKFDNADAAGQARVRFERTWLYTLLLQYLDALYEQTANPDQKQENIIYCERFVEFLCDLLSQLPTRRYVNTLLEDLNLLPATRLSPIYDDSSNDALIREMYDLLAHYTYFPVDNQTGKQQSKVQYGEANNARISRLQKVALSLHPEKLKILILANFGSLAQKDELISHLQVLTDAELEELCSQLSLRTAYPDKSLVVQDRTFLLEILASHICRRPLYTDSLQMSNTILPTEATLYSPSLLRADSYNGTRPLALPKLNLQFLTVGDFLCRSYILHRAESYDAIRKHLEDTLKRLQPRRQGSSTKFEGFSRLAIPIGKPGILDVAPSRVGEEYPAEVRAEVVLDVSRLQPGLRKEWEGLKGDDVVFLLAVQSPDTSVKLTNGHKTENVAEKLGVKAIRCAEVVSVLDENGRILKHDQDTQDHVDGYVRPRQRRLIVRLDASAFKEDKQRADAGKGDTYETINLIVRRRARENNFKAVLETIRQLVLSDAPIPSWLQEVFLGFGDPTSASYKRLPNRLTRIDYRDTFLNWQHLIESTAGKVLEPDAQAESSFPPPYVLEHAGTDVLPIPKQGKKRRRDQPDGPEPAQPVESFKVSTYQPPNNGPYPSDAPKLNTVRFTPAQADAITSGMQPGLTLIVGPPGTGKTDVATQIISNLYHDFPTQRTLLIAHSNQALNQLFEKIVALDIDERHLLRLGHGEEELRTDSSFSKAGRVESFMERGVEFLHEVQRLAESIGAPGAHGASCETAEYFLQVYVSPRWKRFWSEAKAQNVAKEDVVSKFPFYEFFANAPQPMFPPTASKDQVLEISRGCERHITKIFTELADLRPFEILRGQREKSNYLLAKEAKIVAMTATHAAMRRREIAALGFRYENVVVEEAAQMSEIENFIPLAMQNPRQHKANATSDDASTTENPLQRIILIGDHLQNSPIVSNPAYASHSSLTQPLFTRLLRLGASHILLDAQGRSRPSLSQLYSWRYPRLTNLPHTSTSPEFVAANAGFRYDYQFINVEDFKGKGEVEPSPHFIQNLGEAEYAVALYQYMRLLGYPAQKISILTPYAGQRALLLDVLKYRCKDNRLFGMPAWVGTVDKYQGEQNDYVILSLVRTKHVGYLRDLRRLTVALSRARLGLYVLGRRSVFEHGGLEVREAFAKLLQREAELAVVTGELWPGTRGVEDEVEDTKIADVEHLGQWIHEMTKAKVEELKKGGGNLKLQAANEQRVIDYDDEKEEDGVVGKTEGDDEDDEGIGM